MRMKRIPIRIPSLIVIVALLLGIGGTSLLLGGNCDWYYFCEWTQACSKYCGKDWDGGTYIRCSYQCYQGGYPPCECNVRGCNKPRPPCEMPPGCSTGNVDSCSWFTICPCEYY